MEDESSNLKLLEDCHQCLKKCMSSMTANSWRNLIDLSDKLAYDILTIDDDDYHDYRVELLDNIDSFIDECKSYSKKYDNVCRQVVNYNILNPSSKLNVEDIIGNDPRFSYI